MSKRHYLLYLISTVLLSLLPGFGAWAEEERIVELPLIFSQEGTEVRTSACLRVREKIYSADHFSWTLFKEQARTSPEKDLVETIAAILNKNDTRLRELSHSRLGRDPKKYQEQAAAYFRQFEVLQLGNVQSYYQFDNLLVFFLQVNFKESFNLADFPFAREEDGTFGFLPYKTDSLVLRLIRNWATSDRGSAKNPSSAYCAPSLVQRATHKVLLNEGTLRSDSPSELLLIGRPLTGKGTGEQPYRSLEDTISALRKSLMAGQMQQYFEGFTEEGKQRVQSWFLKAKEEERQKYIESFVHQTPFYVFDADPLFIVYTRTGSSGIQALYFVRGKNEKFRWANAAYGTTSDAIFKSRRFIEEAGKDKPFEIWSFPR